MSHGSPDTARVLYNIARNLLQEHDYGELLTNILDMTIHHRRDGRAGGAGAAVSQCTRVGSTSR